MPHPTVDNDQSRMDERRVLIGKCVRIEQNRVFFLPIALANWSMIPQFTPIKRFSAN